MKVSNWKEKLVITIAYPALVAVLYKLGVSCLFLQFLGILCPGCGMTRAMLAALRLDFAQAFALHPMFWSMPILYAYFLLDKGLFPSKKTNSILLHIIGIGFLVQWLLKIVEN